VLAAKTVKIKIKLKIKCVVSGMSCLP
jgi:hypothetical protein